MQSSLLFSAFLLCAGVNGELNQLKGKASLHRQYKCAIRLAKEYHETTLRDNQIVLPVKHSLLVAGSTLKSLSLHYPTPY